MFKRLLLCLAALAALAGCTSNPTPGGDTPLNKLKAATDYGVYVDGEPVFTYDKTEHQLVSGSTGGSKVFRIQTDDQFEYLHCELGSVPTAMGQNVSLNITAKGIDSWNNAGLYTATVVKIDDSRLWLWEEKTSTGFIVPR